MHQESTSNQSSGCSSGPVSKIVILGRCFGRGSSWTLCSYLRLLEGASAGCSAGSVCLLDRCRRSWRTSPCSLARMGIDIVPTFVVGRPFGDPTRRKTLSRVSGRTWTIPGTLARAAIDVVITVVLSSPFCDPVGRQTLIGVLRCWTWRTRRLR